MADDDGAFKVKLKLPTGARARTESDEMPAMKAAALEAARQKLLIGAQGGAALKELLSTAPNPEVAIRDFQAAHGIPWNLIHRKRTAQRSEGATRVGVTPALQLLDRLHVTRSGCYQDLLQCLEKEMLLRIQELSQAELQQLLEATFPYIQFRELRAIPIAILARQDETPESYLRELTENRRILNELPVHVRRKILHVDKQELHLFVEHCAQAYIEEQMRWYASHDQRTAPASASTPSTPASAVDLWNGSAGAMSPATSKGNRTKKRHGLTPEERRRQSAALQQLTEMIGDSESLYLSTIDILKEYIATGALAVGKASTGKDSHADLVQFVGALRNDLVNLQRDRTTPLLRTDPLHKFIWFLDRATKNQQGMDLTHLHELLAVIKRLRVSDLPPNMKFKKKATSVGGQPSDIHEEEENFEIVLGPPPVDELLSLLEKIGKSDARMIFAEPVPADVPKYREIIKDPMDLSTMRKKAKRGKYKSVDMFTEDFNLMIQNCLTFNPDTTIFYKEAKRIGKRGHELIDKSMQVLRGEPQRIRAKKRKKSGPGDVVSMLTSSGTPTISDFGDFEQSGMVPEGLCDDMLADVAMVLCDPLVKQMLCDSIIKSLLTCWQRKELPTDNLPCRGLIQLLQIGNPVTVRRMLRKKEFILRSPQVVTMRVTLPLLLRILVTNRIHLSFAAHTHRESPVTGNEELYEPTLWEAMLRASSAVRSLTKAFVAHCFMEGHHDVGNALLQRLLAAEEELLLRDRTFLSALGDAVLAHIRSLRLTSSAASSGSTADTASHEGTNTSRYRDRVRSSALWKTVMESFFLTILQNKIRSWKDTHGSVVLLSEANANEAQRVVSFAAPIVHEKTAMLLASALVPTKEQDAWCTEADVETYMQQSLGAMIRSCRSIEEFDALYSSTCFQLCRDQYERILAKYPAIRGKLLQYMANPCTASPERQPLPAAEPSDGQTPTQTSTQTNGSGSGSSPPQHTGTEEGGSACE